jgi:hypothetical protein
MFCLQSGGPGPASMLSQVVLDPAMKAAESSLAALNRLWD